MCVGVSCSILTRGHVVIDLHACGHVVIDLNACGHVMIDFRWEWVDFNVCRE